jgi:hypothetical protein
MRALMFGDLASLLTWLGFTTRSLGSWKIAYKASEDSQGAEKLFAFIQQQIQISLVDTS